MVPKKDDKWGTRDNWNAWHHKGRMVNKSGIGVGNAILNNVAYSPQMKYNLISLSWFLDDGWMMTGDTKGIMMVSKGNKLVFDIVVWTETGLVYCLYMN